MFSHNGKISEKQMKRMTALPVFSGGIFILPYLFAKLYGRSLIPGVILFFLMAWLYISCIYALGKWYGTRGICPAMRNRAGIQTPSGRVVAVVQILRYLLRLSVYILLVVDILKEAQVPFMKEQSKNIWVVLPLLFVAVYGAKHNMEKQGRIHEMLFWAVFIPVVVMLLFGLKEMDGSIWALHCDLSPKKLLLYSYALLTCVLPVEFHLYVRPNEAEGKEAFWHMMAVILLLLLLAVLMIGIYGVTGAASESMITIAIMRYIRVPFGILRRVDMIMVWFFMAGCFALLGSTLFYMGYLYEKMIKKAKTWFLLGMVAAAVVIALILPQYEETIHIFLCYGAAVDIPLSLIVPLLSMGIAE